MFHRRHDPAGAALFLTAAFFGFWWLFFTPGQLPRYYWIGNFTLALFTAPLLSEAIRGLGRGPYLRCGLAAGACVVLLVPPLQWTANQGREVYTSEEMRHDITLAQWVRTLPEGTPIVTDFPPLRETLLFYTGRMVMVDSEPTRLPHPYPVFISRHASALASAAWHSHTIGPYTVFERNR